MIFNMLRGYEPQIAMITGSVTDIQDDVITFIPLTVTPIAAILRTTVGSSSEMAVYYREGAASDLVLITGGSGVVKTRLYSESEVTMHVLTEGADKSNVAKLEYWIVGVKRE